MQRSPLSLHSPEPCWIDAWRWPRFRLDRRFAPWLKDRGSLTARVKGRCRRGFRVRLVRQLWDRPSPSERKRLGMRRFERTLLREVELCCGGEPWVFARTLIPARSLRGGARRLAHLGERPLGAVLFRNRSTRRKAMEITRLTARHRLFAAASNHLAHRPRELWGRRTLFLFAGHPLLVNEIFLPTIADHP